MSGDDRLMQLQITRSTPIHASGRVLQMQGMFDVPPAKQSSLAWHVDLPIEERDWNIGLIVGPSGCGKSTIAREAFGSSVVEGFEWAGDRSILDAFPATMGIKELTALLSSVGFSSPPSWMRPFGVLSTGEQFRVFVARALAEMPDLAVIDEFTSVVDRTVAQIGSAAVASAVRRSKRKLVAVTCHHDVLDWLQPDWVYQPVGNDFQWRCLQQRPGVELEIARCDGRQIWPLFKAHHYLSGELAVSARCFLATINERPAAFGSVNHFCHPTASSWKEHRFVVLPDFQGIGIGNRLSEYLGSIFVTTGKRYRGVTSSPAFVQHRRRSPLWKQTRAGGMVSVPNRRKSRSFDTKRIAKSVAWDRVTWTFEYVGPANADDARRFGLLNKTAVFPATTKGRCSTKRRTRGTR